MNIGKLKELIEGKPDSIEILIPWSDHNYASACCRITTALKQQSGLWVEDHGEEITSEAEYGKRETVLVVEDLP